MIKEKKAFIPKQYLAVLSVLSAMMMGVLNGTIMNVALPTLAEEFSVEASTAIWIVNAFQLVITMLMLSFATLGDIYGYRKIFFTGVTRSAFARKKVLKKTKNEGLGRKKFLKILKKVFLACTFLTAIW